MPVWHAVSYRPIEHWQEVIFAGRESYFDGLPAVPAHDRLENTSPLFSEKHHISVSQPIRSQCTCNVVNNLDDSAKCGRIKNQFTQLDIIKYRVSSTTKNNLIPKTLAVQQCSSEQCNFYRMWLTFTFTFDVSPVRLSSAVVWTLLIQLKFSAMFLRHMVHQPSIDIHWKFLQRSSQVSPSSGGGVKRKKARRVAKYSDFGPVEGYISETVQDRRYYKLVLITNRKSHMSCRYRY